ncbi:MAG: hypothetical protein L6Q54_11730 [Leptospiraceae bacterium]|nr:hypothetical protein [Leptospiraceae bacterium]
MTSNDKYFRNPAWVFLLIGFVCDFILAIFNKVQKIDIANYGSVPTFTTAGIAIFLVLQLIPTAKKYLAKK